ncbi:hypothetical protein [Variovorax sp. DXTD-1]|uniref:hypothetical protein n=1 Tax=Variovorax sp. DXTD-1 TaxID=2495592 RepID=UPI001C8E0559|nr:hypothetical protein [Variovorax sp. DXTD-1]
MTREALHLHAAGVLATTTRAWGISQQPRAGRARAALPRLRFALPRVRGFFFAI